MTCSLPTHEGTMASIRAHPPGASSDPSADQSESWKAVTRGRSKSFSDGQNEADTPAAAAMLSKSARKNARRKERKRFEKKWGVRPDGTEAAIGSGGGGGRSRSQSLNEQGAVNARRIMIGPAAGDRDTACPGNDQQHDFISNHDDEALNRALAASILESSSPAAPQDDDPRRKRLRNLRKKITAAESLLDTPRSDLDDGQRAKLERLPSLQCEADTIQDELDKEEQQRIQVQAEHKAREAASHRRRIAEWSALSDGTAVKGFKAGADQDEFACPLCAGPLEAATSCTPCRHVFCRACLEDALGSAADRSGGDPKGLVCPMCRSVLFDAVGDKMLVEPALNVRKKMRKRKCECKCGEEVALSSLRAHLRSCDDAAPGLFADDEKKRFGHEFERPWLDPDKVAQMAGKKRKGGSGPIRSSQQAVARGLVPDGYDEEAALQAALALSSLEV